MSQITLDPNRYRGSDAYQALKLLQADAGSREEIKVFDLPMLRRAPASFPKIGAVIDDFQSIALDDSGDRLGFRTVIGEGLTVAQTLDTLRNEILEIGEGKRPREILTRGRGDPSDLRIVFTAQPS